MNNISGDEIKELQNVCNKISSLFHKIAGSQGSSVFVSFKRQLVLAYVPDLRIKNKISSELSSYELSKITFI